MPFVVYDGEKVYREALEGFQKQLDDLKKGNSKEDTKEEDEASETSMRKTTRRCCLQSVGGRWGYRRPNKIVFEEQLSKLAAHREVPPNVTAPILESLEKVTTRLVESFPQLAGETSENNPTRPLPS